jgi:hypothetical protein
MNKNVVYKLNLLTWISRFWWVLFIGIILVVVLDGCSQEQIELDQLNYQINVSRNKLDELEATIRNNNQILENQIQKKIEYNVATYVIELEIKQSTFTLSIGEHVKNSANAIKFKIPVSREFYEAVSIGSQLSDEFKWGSFFFNGDFSNLHVKVISKEIY